MKRCVDKLPTQKELEACMEEVIKDMLRIKQGKVVMDERGKISSLFD